MLATIRSRREERPKNKDPRLWYILTYLEPGICRWLTDASFITWEDSQSTVNVAPHYGCTHVVIYIVVVHHAAPGRPKKCQTAPVNHIISDFAIFTAAIGKNSRPEVLTPEIRRVDSQVGVSLSDRTED